MPDKRSRGVDVANRRVDEALAMIMVGAGDGWDQKCVFCLPQGDQCTHGRSLNDCTGRRSHWPLKTTYDADQNRHL